MEPNSLSYFQDIFLTKIVYLASDSALESYGSEIIVFQISDMKKWDIEVDIEDATSEALASLIESRMRTAVTPVFLH